MIYLLKSGEFYKIGYTSRRTAAGRIAEIQTNTPHEVTLVDSWEGSMEHEAVLHARFAHCHVRGEWFKLTDAEVASLAAAAIAQRASDAIRIGFAPPDPRCLPDLKFAPGVNVEVEDVGCTWCGRMLHFIGEINYLVCEPCGRKVPMGTIICTAYRRKAVAATMHKHALP